MLSITMLVVLIFLAAAGLMRWHYSRLCLTCQAYFQTGLVRYLPLDKKVTAEYKERVETSVHWNAMWLVVWMIALADVAFLWLAFHLKGNLELSFVLVTAATVAASITHAIQLDFIWVKNCAAAFFSASQTAVEVEMKKLESQLPEIAEELGIPLEELRADYDKLQQVLRGLATEKIRRE